MSFRKAVGVAVAASVFSAVCLTPQTSNAEVSPTGKAIAGGALLGAEVGFMGLSAFGAKDGWMYAVFPIALAGGGGVAGYFIEKGGSPEVPLAMLAGGMALIIPTVVITLSANAYQPSNTEDSTPSDATPAEGVKTIKVDAGGEGGAGSGAKKPAEPAKLRPTTPKVSARTLPVALVNLSSESLRLAMPLVRFAPAYTRMEQEKFGVAQTYEVHASFVSVAF